MAAFGVFEVRLTGEEMGFSVIAFQIAKAGSN